MVDANPRGRLLLATLFLLLAFGLGLGSGYLIWRVPEAPPVSLNTADVPCLGILDGDTIRVAWQGKELKVRMLGIECMETHAGKKLKDQIKQYGLKDWEIGDLGKRALSRTTAMCSNQVVRLVFPGQVDDRDAFGRLLAYVEVDGQDLGLSLLSSGLAVEYPSNHPRREDYRRAISEARRLRFGLWSAVR